MSINTKFNIGDEAWTIDLVTLRVVRFIVGRVVITEHTDGSVSECVDPSDGNGGYNYKGYDACKCFPSRDGLVNHLVGDDSDATEAAQVTDSNAGNDSSADSEEKAA